MSTGFTTGEKNETVEKPALVEEAATVPVEENQALPSGITVSDSGEIALAENDETKHMLAEIVNTPSATEEAQAPEEEAVKSEELAENVEVEAVAETAEINNIEPQAETVSEEESPYMGIMAMEATAYLPADGGGSGITAMGIPATYGVAAVDPSIIPLGTRLYIPGYGEAIAADTGGAIQGYRIDLCMESYEQAMHFGRRTITVYLMN